MGNFCLDKDFVFVLLSFSFDSICLSLTFMKKALEYAKCSDHCGQ